MRINENLNLPNGGYATSFLQENPDLTLVRMPGRVVKYIIPKNTRKN